jgi:hypothetical protein
MDEAGRCVAERVQRKQIAGPIRQRKQIAGPIRGDETEAGAESI